MVKEKPARQPRRKAKNDPRLVSAARELRDRWLEQVNATPLIGQGKYEVSRAIAAPVSSQMDQVCGSLRALPLAA